MGAGVLQCGALCGLNFAVLPPPLSLAPLTGARGQDPGWREYPAGQAPVSEPPAEEGRGGCLSVRSHVSVGMDAESVGSGLNLTYPDKNHVTRESHCVNVHTYTSRSFCRSLLLLRRDLYICA